jgi:pimeloyl-ACP methyl ester carboxylesterase
VISSAGRVIIVPGLAVRRYAVPAAGALRAEGYNVSLQKPPAWRGVPVELDAYGEQLARTISGAGQRVSELVGLSVGTQAAAVAAMLTPNVDHLLLISPTVDPSRRSRARLLAAWVSGDDHEDAPGFTQQIPDWAHAGPVRIYRGFRSAIQLHLEDVLANVTVPITVVHADCDNLTSHSFAADLAERFGSRPLVVMPHAPHSWPVGDEQRFVAFIMQLTAEAPK